MVKISKHAPSIRPLGGEAMRCGFDIPQGSNPGAGRVYSRDVARFGVILAMHLAWVMGDSLEVEVEYGSLLTPSAEFVAHCPRACAA